LALALAVAFLSVIPSGNLLLLFALTVTVAVAVALALEIGPGFSPDIQLLLLPLLLHLR
jgi:hypothetical protein